MIDLVLSRSFCRCPCEDWRIAKAMAAPIATPVHAAMIKGRFTSASDRTAVSTFASASDRVAMSPSFTERGSSIGRLGCSASTGVSP